MPERLKAILDKITAWWKKFNTKQRSVLISIVAVVIVALVILGVVISRPTQVELVEAQSASEASQRRMMQDVPKADVVITNPTHFAVAVKYDAQKNDAPVVVAKGQDYVAQKIKEIARDNNIRIVENKPLARMLFHNVDLGAEIPPELYRSVAEILAMIYKENN